MNSEPILSAASHTSDLYQDHLIQFIAFVKCMSFRGYSTVKLHEGTVN